MNYLNLFFPDETVRIPHDELPKAHGLPLMNPRKWLKKNRPELLKPYNEAERKKMIQSIRFEENIRR